MVKVLRKGNVHIFMNELGLKLYEHNSATRPKSNNRESPLLKFAPKISQGRTVLLDRC